MINGSVCHLVGLNLVNDGVKGRVVSVRTEGYATSVEVVTEAGAFAMWRLHQCVEAEPGALVRAIEESSERIDRILGKTKPAEPPPVAEPVVVDDGKETLVWIQGSPSTSEDTWHLGHEGGDWFGAPYSSWDWLQAASYIGMGAAKKYRVSVKSHRDGCKTVAAWAREDGYVVPPHPVYGEI